MKTHNLLMLSFTITFLLFLSGCAGKTVIVQEPLSSLTADKAKAYIAFAYDPPKLLGPTPEALLYEFNATTFEQKLLIEFDTHGKFLQEVTPGKHFYIIRRVMPALALQEDVKYQFSINAKQGEITYVDLQMLKVMTPERKILEGKLQKMSCNSDNLTRYNFEEIQEEKDSSNPVSSFEIRSNVKENSILKYKSPLFGYVEIGCVDNKVINLSSGSSFFKVVTLKGMDELPIIKAAKELDNYKLLQKDDINDKYTIFHLLHKDAFQNYLFEIYEYSETSDEHKYGNIETVINLPKNFDSEDGLVINKTINDTFTSYISTNDNETLKIIFNVENYITGNRAKRYFALSYDNAFESMASFQLSAEFVDVATGKKIGKVKATRVLGIGIFGGSASGLVEDAVNDILTYAKSVYIKK